MNKTCTTCKWEPGWIDDDLFSNVGIKKFGKCRYPSTPKYSINPVIFIPFEKDDYLINIDDHHGRPMYNYNQPCQFWEGKEKATLKLCRNTFNELKKLQYENGEYRTDIQLKTFNRIPYEII